jgi:hypothetical protein
MPYDVAEMRGDQPNAARPLLEEALSAPPIDGESQILFYSKLARD